MKRLYLMRHGHAEWAARGQGDHERTLSAAGHAGAARMGSFLGERFGCPELVVVSDAVRTRETSVQVVRGLGYASEVEFSKRLYLAEPDDFFEVLGEVAHGVESVLCVAHNPGLTNLVQILTLRQIDMAPASLAVIDLQVDEIASVGSVSEAELIGFFSLEGENVVSA